MRIAIFTDTYAPEINGVARTLKRLTAFLQQKHIAYQVYAPQSPHDRQSHPHEVRLPSLPFLLYPELRMALPNYIQLQRSFLAFRPTLIHVVTPFNLGLLGLRLGKKHRLPLVASYHTNFDQYLHYYNLQFLENLLWKYMRWFHRPFHSVFVPSISTREKLLEQGVHQQIKLWSRGVDATRYSPVHRSNDLRQKLAPGANQLILYVGRLAPEKDVEVALNSFHALPETLKKDSHLIVAGDGPLYQTLTEKPHPQVTYTGFVEGQRLAELYASCDVFLFPSPSETFGNVVLEAMASGLPVIGAEAGGVKHLIQQQETGLLCPPGDVQAFTVALTSLLVSQEQRMRMSIQARNYARKQSWDQIMEQLLHDYLEAERTGQRIQHAS